MSFVKKLRDLLKRAFGVVGADKKLEKRVRNYVDAFYEFCYKESYLSSGESVPYYFYWEESSRRAFFVMLFFVAMIICTLIYTVLKLGIGVEFAILVGLLVVYLIIMIRYYVPSYYLDKRLQFKIVRVIRLNTKEAIAQFERDYEKVEALAKPYREQREKQQAEQKAVAEEKQRLKAEEKARKAEELRNAFRPQYMALLEYVETYYKVSTPDPDIYDGYFTIILPDIESDDRNVEIRFAYADEKSGINQLIARIAKMDPVMRKRVELHERVEAALTPTIN